MSRALRRRGEAALGGLIVGLEKLRGRLSRGLDEVDLEELRRLGSRYAATVQRSVGGRLRPRPRRRFPWAGVAALGATAVAVGILFCDKGRRDALKGQAARLQENARRRYAELGGLGGAVEKVKSRWSGGGVALDEAQLEARVREALTADPGAPAGLKVSVEGRTVYLRGAVEDPAAVDRVVERVQALEGVVAVVNLTTSPAPSGSPRSDAAG